MLGGAEEGAGGKGVGIHIGFIPRSLRITKMIKRVFYVILCLGYLRYYGVGE